ncbi:MAG: ATP-binding cassette domain-containing protein [Chlamydiae bacterium]|nr:ATP-binding cassette domain-containing protein [Chlamydiota bacterium]
MKTLVQTRDLRKKFPSKGSFVEVLQGVDLDVFEGEIFGFLGPNGAGKTTFLKILTTLSPFDSGEAFVAGFSIKESPDLVRQVIGYVSQKGGADPRSKGIENLLLQGQLYGLTKKEALRQAENLIEIFDLSDCIKRAVSTYSGGQQRRLDLALGMMHTPKLLFLDEPTTGLDPQNRANLWEKLRHLKNQGVTIFLTSHYLDEVDELSDRLAILDHGKIVAQGTAQELKRQISGDIVTIGFSKAMQEKAKQFFVQGFNFVRETTWHQNDVRLSVESGEASLVHLLRLLDAAQLPLETLQLSLPTLDDVFLKKTGRSLREEAL